MRMLLQGNFKLLANQLKYLLPNITIPVQAEFWRIKASNLFLTLICHNGFFMAVVWKFSNIMHVITADDSQGIILWAETESTLLVIKPTIDIGPNYVLFEVYRRH